MPSFHVENRFDAPPEYVRDWLTDVRPDDGRFFGETAVMTVTRKGNEIVREHTNSMGLNRIVITIESPTRWRGKFTVTKGGKLVMTGDLVETVEPEKTGTIHRVRGDIYPQTFSMKVMAPLMMPIMARGVRKGFVVIKKEMEASYKAGKPPTA
ncbi:MAG: SRPBCC family protein [Methanobacteriota archaeon]